LDGIVSVYRLYVWSKSLICRWLNIRQPADAATAEVTDDERRRIFGCQLGGELPLAYIAWLVYSLGLSAKISIIYGPQYRIVDTLTVHMFLGLNTLRLAVSLSGVVFFLLVSTHHDAPAASERQVSVAMETSDDDDDDETMMISLPSSHCFCLLVHLFINSFFI